METSASFEARSAPSSYPTTRSCPCQFLKPFFPAFIAKSTKRPPEILAQIH